MSSPGDLESSKDFRYECAERIEAKIREHPCFERFRLQAIHIATILLVPQGCLEDSGFLGLEKPAKTLRKNLMTVASLVRHYLIKFEEDRSDSASSNETEKDTCRRRDNSQCLFTGTSTDHVVHILPFTWNKTKGNVHETDLVIDGCRAFFTDEICYDLEKLFINPRNLCSSDKHWNMINISDSLHAYLPCAFFGLKCLGIKPQVCPKTQDPVEAEWEVVVQFQWLHRRWGKPNEEMTIMDGGDSMKNMAETQIQHEKNGSPPTSHPGGWKIAATNIDTLPIISGDIFTITMSEQDAAKCKMMLDLQWFILSIAAMSGAAGYPDLLPIVEDTQAIIMEEWQRSYHFW